MQCHEVWSFDNTKGIQKLVGLIALCDDCHKVIHWFRTYWLFRRGKISGKEIGHLEKHFCTVNKCRRDQMQNHIRSSYDIMISRNAQEWKIHWGGISPQVLINRYNKMMKEKKR